MTVSYSSEVFTCKATGIFLRLLFRWRGSIYKLVWCDLLVYMTLYSALSITYRFFLDDEGNERNHGISRGFQNGTVFSPFDQTFTDSWGPMHGKEIECLRALDALCLKSNPSWFELSRNSNLTKDVKQWEILRNWLSKPQMQSLRGLDCLVASNSIYMKLNFLMVQPLDIFCAIDVFVVKSYYQNLKLGFT